ncbi:phosphopantetheine-binding protein [Actinomadura fibrosa]|uniref:Phosphopantetheine-binding protein n=1 Tax=Actinomadura fibrosa TaxID=111802 RepID=A0ABW2XM89_9ACTN|nr:phosphopantetheine-binding protein [Actinomadura fibrosa]
MRQIWEEVLRVPVGDGDSFFALGGDSLTAVRIVNRVRERLGAALTVLDVFDAPTVPELTIVAHRTLITVD